MYIYVCEVSKKVFWSRMATIFKMSVTNNRCQTFASRSDSQRDKNEDLIQQMLVLISAVSYFFCISYCEVNTGQVWHV